MAFPKSRALADFVDRTWLAQDAQIAVTTTNGEKIAGRVADVISKGDRPEVVTLETEVGFTSVFVGAIATVSR